MQIFLSYASEDRELAEEIQLALVGAGHQVFFDRASLPAGGDYRSRIRSAVQSADIFIFLITPNSVAQGSYARTELKYAREKWAHPKEKLLPVLVRDTSWNAIPAYLKSVTVLLPEGNVAAEVLTAVESMTTYPAQPDKSVRLPPPHDNSPDDQGSEKTGASYTIQIWVAVVGLAGVLGGAVIENWNNIFGTNSEPPPITGAGMKGTDTGSTASPVFNSDCPEITFTDYSKFPWESRKERRCNP